MPKWERRHIKAWSEGSRYGDIERSDLLWARSFLLKIALPKGAGHVLGIEGETLPQIGMLAITLDRAGVPVGAFIPADDATKVYTVQIGQSNPRRAEEDDTDANGANDADD